MDGHYIVPADQKLMRYGDLKIRPAVSELHLDSPRPSPREISLPGNIEADINGKMSSGRTYN